ncbi:MAG: response regulator, partial [Anaerolineae bacterium]
MDSEIGVEGNKESILVVDDLRGNRQLLSMLLSPEGYRVYTAENGKQALEIVQDQPLDLILLDIMMPEMNGYETCERLKASPETQHIPVIFLTARNAAQDKVKAFAVGGVDFITKPFNNEEVLARIEVHLTLQRIQKDLQKKNDQLEREITERKKAKAVLQQYAERLRVLNEINQSILAARSPSNVALAAVGRLRQLIPCQRVLIMNISTSGELQMLAVESNGLLKPIDKELYHDLFDNPSLNRGLTQGSNDLQVLPQHSSFLKALCTAGVRS